MPPVLVELDVEEMHLLCAMLPRIMLVKACHNIFAVGHNHVVSSLERSVRAFRMWHTHEWIM